MADENQNYSSYNGMLFDAEQANLLLVPEGMEGNAVLPVSVASVPAYAFSRCTKLSAITLTGSTGASAFTTQDGILYSADGSQLLAAPAGIGSTATIAPACTHIAEGAFWGNVELRTIVVNGTVESIAVPRELSEGETAKTPETAFNDATIKSATVVLNVAEGEREGAQAAWQAAGFTSFAEGAEPGASIEPVEGSGFAFDLKDDYTLAVRWQGEEPAPEKLEVPSYGIIEGISYKVGSIADEGFAGQEAIQCVELPEGISVIGNAAFKGATCLNTISIPGSVTSIGDEAFSGCDELVALDMAEGISSIGDHAFEGIAQKAIIVPASVKAVGDYAFANSPNLEMVVALGEVEQAGQSALGGTSGVSLYVPYRADGAYAWAAGLPATGNHLMPYGVKAPESTIEVNVGEQAELFAEGYLEVPEGFEVSYAYKAKPISIADDGTIEGKEGGASNVEVTLTLEVPRQVVSGIVSKQARLTQAAYDPTATPFVQAADVVEATQPVTVSATASVLSVERATTGKTITFRSADPTKKFYAGSYSGGSRLVSSITLTGVTNFSYDQRLNYIEVNGDARATDAGWENQYGTWNIGHSYASAPPDGGTGWSMDPAKPHETYSYVPDLASLPDETTLWWVDSFANHRGNLTIRTSHTSLTSSNVGTISSGGYKTFYDVSSYNVYNDSIAFYGKTTSTASSTLSITLKPTASSGWTYAGVRSAVTGYYGSEIGDSKKQSGTYYLSGDTVIEAFSYASSGQTIKIKNSPTASSTTSYSGITSVYADKATGMLSLYKNETLYTNISAKTADQICWTSGYYGETESTICHELNGRYYPTGDTTITAVPSNMFVDGFGVETYPTLRMDGSYSSNTFTEYVSEREVEAYDARMFYRTSRISVLQNGSIEFLSSGCDTHGVRQSSLIVPKNQGNLLGFMKTGLSGLILPYKIFCPGEAYYLIGKSVNLDYGSRTTTVTLNNNTPSGATLTTSISPGSITATYGLAFPTLTRKPAVKGYSFEGLYSTSASSGGIQYYSSSSGSTWFYPSTTASAYARWTVKKVSVSYNGNNHTSGSMASHTISYTDASKNLKANAFTRTGYSFQGWATSQSNANAGTVTYANGASMQSYLESQTATSASLSLYAVWKQDTLTVTLKGGSASGDPSSTATLTTSNNKLPSIASLGWTKAGYKQIGWSETANSSTVQYQDQAAMTIPAGASTKTLYAVWANNTATYAVHHMVENADNGDYTLSETVTVTAEIGSTVTPEQAVASGTIDYAEAGYIWEPSRGTNTDQIVAADGSTAFWIAYKRQMFSVTYSYDGAVPEGATPPAAVQLKWGSTVTLPTPDAVAGYEFLGWKADTGGDALYQPGHTFPMPKSDKQIAGTWKATEVDVTVNNYLQNADDNEYTLGSTKTVKCLAGQSVSPTTFGTVSNYTRNTLKGDVFPKTIAGDGSTVFNIYWDRERYNLTYQYSGDIPEGAPELPATVKVRHGATVTLPEVSSIGTCVFKGWSINDSTELVTDATFIMPVRKTGTTVTGVWEYSDKYTVVYDKGFEGDDQTGPVDSTVYHVGDAVTLAQNNPPAAGFTRDGYIFLGWSTTAGHTNTGFRPGQQVALDNWIQNGVVTLYAVWGPQVNVSSPITPSIKLMVRPSSAGSTSGALSESVAVNANLFTSQTPEDVLVSSMSCEPISGENGTAKVFKHENLWQFINVLLDGGGSAQASLPLSAATSLRQFTMDSDDKFIIPSGGELPVEVDLDVPEYVQVAIVDDEVDIARLAFTFQLAQPTE